jgi:hypothetical protein
MWQALWPMSKKRCEMIDQEEYFFNCPYCWQQISMLLDRSVESQSFIEDCEVCCNPIEISYSVDEEAINDFRAEKAQP